MCVQFFTQLSKEIQERIEISFISLSKDCQQQLQIISEKETDSNLAASYDNYFNDLQDMLSCAKNAPKIYIEQIENKTIAMINHVSPQLQEAYADYWFYMRAFLPDLLSWFAQIIIKILKSIRDHPIEPEVTVKFIEIFFKLFRTPLYLIRHNYDLFVVNEL